MKFLEFLKAIFFGIVEGITEWLPVSSTGHMILVEEFLGLKVSPEVWELFLVVIQLGAILAVPVLFFDKLNPFSRKKSDAEKKATWSLWFKVALGVVPAGVIGLLFEDFFEEKFYNYVVVAIALILYGIAFIAIERYKSVKKSNYRVDCVEQLSYLDALIIGGFQVLSLIPGTSRSGSTILGGMMSGVSRTASAEFSFFMAIPIMVGASLWKILKFLIAGYTATGMEIALLLTGVLVSFLVSLLIIKFLMDFVKRHSFSVFGIYRILLGAIVLGYFLISK